MEKVFLSKIDNRKYLSFYLDSIEKSLCSLNCEKPVITIPSVKISQFQPLLNKFGFKLSSVLNTYGRTRNDEYFYNI